jgi:hypothetical protein
MRRPLAIFGLILAACARAEQAVPEIPSSEDLVVSTTAATTTTAPRPSLEEATLQFTDCMRTEGIDLPDIRIGADGRPQLGDISDRVDIASPEFAAALDECAPLLSEAGALDLGSDPELQAVVQDQLQRFSECMREEGVDDFPDPVPGFTGTGLPYPMAEIPLSDPEFADAIEVCQQQVAFTGLND